MEQNRHSKIFLRFSNELKFLFINYGNFILWEKSKFNLKLATLILNLKIHKETAKFMFNKDPYIFFYTFFQNLVPLELHSKALLKIPHILIILSSSKSINMEINTFNKFLAHWSSLYNFFLVTDSQPDMINIRVKWSCSWENFNWVRWNLIELSLLVKSA